MTSNFAQASSPLTNGASKSSDFQPPTGNPQTGPGQLFPQTPLLQDQSYDEVLQNRNAEISVPSNPASDDSLTILPKNNNGPMLIAVAIILSAIIVAAWFRTRSGPKSTEAAKS